MGCLGGPEAVLGPSWAVLGLACGAHGLSPPPLTIGINADLIIIVIIIGIDVIITNVANIPAIEVTS